MQRNLTYVLACVLGLGTMPAVAGTVTFDYTGTPGASFSSGTGTFSYAGALASVGLGDLTSFTFNLCVNNGGTCFPPFTFSDLLSFSATIDAGSVTALSLTTDFVDGTNGAVPEDFVVSGLGAGQAENESNSQGDIFLVDQGIVTTAGPGVASVTEPGMLALFGVGLVGLGAMRRRRAA